MRFMIGGCSAAGSLDLMSTYSAAGLLALFGLMVALIRDGDGRVRGACHRQHAGTDSQRCDQPSTHEFLLFMGSPTHVSRADRPRSFKGSPAPEEFR